MTSTPLKNYVSAIAFLTLNSLFAFCSIAVGQEPTAAIDVIEPPLVSVLPSDDSLISNSGVFEDSVWSDPVDQQFAPADDYEIFNQALPADLVGNYATAASASQSIQMRKNVLGCQACYQVRPEDEVWVVSVRRCDVERADLAQIEVNQFVNSTLQASTLDALTGAHQNDPSRCTLLYIHGNQTNYEYALARGFQFYNNLFVETSCPRPPLRLVLWVWQSEREKPRLSTDYLVKSNRAVQLGKSLTRTLERFGNRKMTLVAFSLGAQIVLASLEEMEPQCDCEVTDEKYNVALIAPATDPTYVCNVINRNLDTSIVHKTIIVENKNDRAVRAMRVVLRRECPEARQIFSELAFEHHFPLAGLQLIEVTRELTRRHSIDRYTKAPAVKRAMIELLTNEQSGCQFSP